MMGAPRVVAWVPTDLSLQVMARATAEAALRGAELCLLSTSAAPHGWSAWLTAARSLGVAAGWCVVPASSRNGDMPESVLAESERSCLVVADVECLRGVLVSSLVRRADVYVVAGGNGESRPELREPAVVVGVPDSPDHAHLLSVGGHEARLRHRQLIVVHAQTRPLAGPDHRMEHRWLDAVSLGRQPSDVPAATRIVVTHRPIVDALRDHVDSEDVLVVGVHPPGEARQSLAASLFDAPPCDLLLTTTAGAEVHGLAR